jgi:hypothetical protein
LLGPNASPQQLVGFGNWLVKHSMHVCSISISLKELPVDQDVHGGPLQDVHGMPWQRYLDLTQQLLPLTMRAVSAAQLQPPAAALQDSNGQQQRQQQRSWRLASFSSDLPGAADLLPLLPAYSLTYLSLDLQHEKAVAADSSALSSALAGLRNLQFLRLSSKPESWEEEASSASCLAGVAQLSQLTELQLLNDWSDIDQPLQQLLAQPLPLRKLLLHVQSDLPDVNLAHLTQLELLDHRWHSLTPRSVLPQQLQRLQLGAVECAEDLEVLMQLPSLQWLSILVRTEDHALLLQLAKHPSLQELALRYDGSEEALATAAAWRQLPQLRELQMKWEHSLPQGQQIADMTAGIAAATGLTKLLLPLESLDEEDTTEFGTIRPSPVQVTVCASLAALTNLKHLELCCVDAELTPGDALALTALTKLTHLVSTGAGLTPRGEGVCGVGGAAVAEIMRSLKQLQHLRLDECRMRDLASLAAVGQLTQLTELQLMGVGGVTLEGLNLLTGLSRLQQLTLQTGREVPDDVLQQFAQRHGISKAVSKPVPRRVVTYVARGCTLTHVPYGAEESEQSDEYEDDDEFEEEEDLDDM